MTENIMEITTRPAKLSDFVSVMNIEENAFLGADYLASVFPTWIKAENRLNFVLESRDKIVGYFGLSCQISSANGKIFYQIFGYTEQI